AVGTYTASGNSLLAVGMPCAFYSQQKELSIFGAVATENVRLVELCTLQTIVVLKGFSGIRSFVILIKHLTCLNNPLRIVLSVDTRLMVIIVRDVLFSERNLRKICLHFVLKMEFSKILLSHPMTIPTLLCSSRAIQDIFCHQCTCELCGRGAHYGYNYPSKVPVVPNPEPFNNQINKELPPTVPSFDQTCYSKDGNSFTYVSTSNLVRDSPNVFSTPLQPRTYSYEFCGNDAYDGHDCSLQVLFTYDPKPLYINTLNWDRPIVCYNDDDEDYAIAVTPSLSIEEPDNSLSMGDEYLDTIPAIELDEFIESSVENLVLIPSESEGVLENMCDVPFHNNSLPLNISKDQFEDFSNPNDESTSTDDDSFSIDNIEYVEVSPPDSELVSSEVMEIVIPEVGGIDDDILLTIKDDILHISSGSTTTHSDSSLYDSFIFDLLINPFPSADRSDFYEFDDELTHIISPPEYDCFFFKIEPNSRDFTMDVVEDNFPTREPRVHNALPTHPTLQLNLDFILSSESFFTYVVWIFLPFLSYFVAPQYLLSSENEDTVFDLGICSYHISSFLPNVSHWSGTFIKFKVFNESPMEISFSTCSPMVE
nr:hypothetical protein [Tanacetum cinerariifolium]